MKYKKLIVLPAIFASFNIWGYELSKNDWITHMSTAIPAMFCKSDSYFRKCFSVTAEECENTALTATRICLKKNESNMPDPFIQPRDGTHWGRIVGKCAGETFWILLNKKSISNEECKSIVQPAEKPLRLQSGNKVFPISASFPVKAKTGTIPHPVLPRSVIYYFMAEDLSASLMYTVSIFDIPRNLGSIPSKTAKMMINKSLESQITSFDSKLGVTAKITFSDQSLFSGYPSKLLHVERQATPNMFGIYRAIIVDRLLVTIWSSGIDTPIGRQRAATFIKSLVIVK
jgi:hypothetical protein